MDSILKKFAVKEFGFFFSENKGINQKKKQGFEFYVCMISLKGRHN